MDLCEDWAEKLIELNDSQGGTRLKCRDFLTINRNEASFVSDEILGEALLEIERRIKDDIWKKMKLKSLCKLLYGDDDSDNWNKFKELSGVEGSKDKTIEEKRLDYDQIQRICDLGNSKKVKKIAALRYLKNNEYVFRYSCEYERCILKECVSAVLYKVIFGPQNEDDKIYDEMVSVVLFPFKDHLNTLSSYEAPKEQKETFVLKLWKKLILLSTNIDESKLASLIRDYKVKNDKKRNYESELDKLCKSIDVDRNTAIEGLIKYAKAYTGCRETIDDNNETDATQLSSLTHKNLKLYVELCDEYKVLYEKYFYLDENGQCYDSIAGIRDESNLVLSNPKGKIEIAVNRNLAEGRTLLDVCIRFYRALKNERNATNHSEEVSSKHMDYQYTRKAVFVFVELFRRLEAQVLNGKKDC